MVEYAFGRLSQQGRKTVDYHPAVIRYLEVSVIHDFTCLFHAPIEFFNNCIRSATLFASLSANNRIGLIRVASSSRMSETDPPFSRTPCTTQL